MAKTIRAIARVVDEDVVRTGIWYFATDPESGDSGKIKMEDVAKATVLLEFPNTTAPEIERVCADTTVTGTEIDQLAGVNVGGNTAGDIITTNGTQTLTNKGLTTPLINGEEVTVNGTQLDLLSGCSSTGNLRNVEQGGNIGNPTVTVDESRVAHGYTEINASADMDFTLLPTTNNVRSEQVTIFNSTTSGAKVYIYATSPDVFRYTSSSGLDSTCTRMTLSDEGIVHLMAYKKGWLVLGKAGISFS